MHRARAKLLALDLDGTLLNSKGRVSAGNAAAVRRAREAGVRVVVATGRGWIECRDALEAIDQRDPIIVASGALTCDGPTGRTIDRVTMAGELVSRSVAAMHAHGHAALVLKDREAAGYDYLVLGGEDEHPIDPISRWWFEHLRAEVRFARGLEDDDHPEQTVRVGLCGEASRADVVAGVLQRELGPAALVHNFSSVIKEDRSTGVPRRVSVVEVCDTRATKWDAVSRLAAGWGIAAEEIVAIGDEINDLSMLAGAGLAIAMANANEAVLKAAHRVTGHHDADGVAEAIGRVLDGTW